MKTHVNNKRLYLKYGLLAFLVVVLIAAALFGLKMWEKQRGRFPELTFEEKTLSFGGKEYKRKDNIETFLVMGLDKFEGDSVSDSYNNDKQADFLMLFVFDNEAKKCTALQINRDTMTDVNVLGVAGNRIDTLTSQIALAHTYGNGRGVSCRNTADSVSALLLGGKINHYISLTMDSVAVFNDLVGGVEVEVLDDFSGIDDTLVKGEKVTLMGEHSLNYVRTRRGLDDSTNNTRMKRQHQYIDALYEKTMQKVEEDEEFFIDASLEMADYIVSDRSVTQLQDLANKFVEYEFERMDDIEGETVRGEKFMEFYPDEESVFKTVIALFYEPVIK
ncbi:MAG: hypothetical protein E7598_01215 [Ruminococcaceae bacterium]|nr:hypothetical protein [Oscillospiraceae bacterium]